MRPETLSRLKALELQIAALAEQVAALVSEAEHEAQMDRAEPKEPAPPPTPQFYGGFQPKAEQTDASAKPGRARRSP